MPRKKEEKVIPIDAQRTKRSSRPASTPELREQQLANLAVDLAEKQLREGTASSAVITHYLKVASKREVLERQILQENAGLIKAKASSIKQAEQGENDAKAALEAMKTYSSSSR